MRAFLHPAELARVIKDEGIDKWADFEMCLGDHSRHFSNTEDGIDDYLKQVEALEVSLSQWLKNEDDKVPNDTLHGKVDSFLTSFANVVPMLAKDGVRVDFESTSENSLSFLCFNYTSAFSRMVQSAADGVAQNEQGTTYDIGPIIHPHGTLDTLLVCGVDGADQISNPSLQENETLASALVKEQIQRADSFNFDRDAIQIIDESDIICIYGMSLGLSDRRWWKHIATALYSPYTPVKEVVIFSYEMNGTNLTVPPARLRARNHVKVKFLSAAEADQATSERIKPSIQVFPSAALPPNLT